MSRAQDLLEEGEKFVDGEDWPQALRNFKDALALFREDGADYDAAATAMRIAGFPDEGAGYRLRLSCARKAAAVFKRLGNLSEAANALKRVADIQLEKSRIFAGSGSWLAWWYRKAAHRNWRKAIDLYERAGMALESARIRFDLGEDLQVYEKNDAAALRLYAVAEPVLRSLGNDRYVAHLLFLKGNALFIQEGGNAEVVGILREALRLFQEQGNRNGTGLALKYIVQAAAAYDRAEARHFANMALAFAWETDDPSLAEEIGDLLSRIPK